MNHAFPPHDQVCFIDANILYYSVVSLPEVSDYCTVLCKEIASGTRQAATIASAVADAVHKVMFGEVVKVHNRPRAGLLSWVKQHPDAIKSLTEFVEVSEEFSGMPLRWLNVDAGLFSHAAALSLQHGLLTNDALIIAAMQQNNIRHLVTNDNDFDRVPDIKVWKPRS